MLTSPLFEEFPVLALLESPRVVQGGKELRTRARKWQLHSCMFMFIHELRVFPGYFLICLLGRSEIVSGIPYRWKKDLSVDAASGSVFLRNL